MVRASRISWRARRRRSRRHHRCGPRRLRPNLAADLRAGRITPKAAIDKVINRIVDQQLGTGAPAAVREQVRSALADAVADDPLLGEKLKQLG